MILLPATVFGPILEQVRSKTGYEFWGHGLWAGGGFWPLKQGPDLTPDLAKKWVQKRIFQKTPVFRSILGMVYYARARARARGRARARARGDIMAGYNGRNVDFAIRWGTRLARKPMFRYLHLGYPLNRSVLGSVILSRPPISMGRDDSSMYLRAGAPGLGTLFGYPFWTLIRYRLLWI